MTNQIPITDRQAIDQLRSELRLEPGRLRRLRIALFKKSLGVDRALAELPTEVRQQFAERVDFHPLQLHKRCDSQLDGASKLIFRTRAGMLIESVVLRAATGRVALCVSSQVGCAAACDFCATGKMGMAHNLSTAEIVDQYVQANEQLRSESPETGGRSVRNLVFMGMGEPFHNEAALHEALTSLTDPAVVDHPPSRILVSTVGVTEGMTRLAAAFPRVNLALSLHSVRQETRESIIPLAKRYSLDLLQATLRQIGESTGRQVMIEYLMLAEKNDSLEEAAELVAWLRGTNAHVNLIPYNPVDDAPHLTSSDKPTREAFARVLKEAGVPTTIRYSMGADIEAACGQLVRRENRAVARAAAMAKT